VKIRLNGNEYETADNITVSEILKEKGTNPSAAVVEMNGEIISKENYDKTVITPDSVLEVLRFVGGG